MIVGNPVLGKSRFRTFPQKIRFTGLPCVFYGVPSVPCQKNLDILQLHYILE